MRLVKNRIYIKIIGDSIAAGEETSDFKELDSTLIKVDNINFKNVQTKKSWGALLNEYLNKENKNIVLNNNGCCGMNSTQLRENINKLVSEKDDIVFILIGLNDRKRENGLNELYSNLKYIINHLRDKKIILMTPTISTKENENKPSRIYHTIDIIKIIRKISKEENIKLIDNYKNIENYLKENNLEIYKIMIKENCLNDGLHPTDLVHKLIFENILESKIIYSKTI